MKIKILLAEDDTDDQFFFTDFLGSREDIEILPIANNGEELIEYLDALTDSAMLPDTIILDQNMPKFTGLQTLEFLKASDKYAHLFVMVYSTYADDVLIKKSKDLGASLVMMKPANAKGYNHLIDNLLKVLSITAIR